MESSLETLIASIIFLTVFIWALTSLASYLTAREEYILKSNLLEYSNYIKDYIIANKEFGNPSTDPRHYNINSRIFIEVMIKEYVYRSDLILIKEIHVPVNSSTPKFIDKAEAIGAYVNDSLIIVKVIVYGIP